MNWIKANKFLAGFFAVMLVGIGVLGYFLFTASSDFDTADDNYHQKATELSRLRHLQLYPNAKNLKALEAQKDEAAQMVAAFQGQLTTREFPSKEITPQEFQDELKHAVTSIVEKAGAAQMELPKDKFYLGFDPYETRPPEPEAVGPLTRQLQTIQWVMERLIEKKVAKLVSLKRYPLPEEKSLSSQNNRGGGRPERQERGAKDLVSRFPFDVEFVAKQKSLSEALDAIAGAQKQPFVIPRVVRFTNEKTKGPERAGAPGSSTSAASSPASGYIVGEEMIIVSMRLEMVEFAAPKEKEGATAKPKGSK